MTVTGQVTGTDGFGVEGAVLHLIDQSGSTLRTTSTDADGNYSFSTSTGEVYHVLCQYREAGSAFNSLSRPFTAPGTSIDFRVEEYSPPANDAVNFKISLTTNIDGKFNGFVKETDASSPKRVEGATVTVEQGDGTTSSDTTDSNGEFVIDGVPEGESVTVRVEYGGEERLIESREANFDTVQELAIPVYSPEITDATPDNKEVTSEGDIDLSVDITDRDFKQDEVSVEFLDVDGNTVGTDTVSVSTNDGTATATATFPRPDQDGIYNWSVELSDSFNSTATVEDDFRFSIGQDIEGVEDTKGAIAIVYAHVGYKVEKFNEDFTVDSGEALLEITDETTGKTLLQEDNYSLYEANDARHFQVVEVGENLNANDINFNLRIRFADANAGFEMSFGGYIMSDHVHAIEDVLTSKDAGLHEHPAKAGVTEQFQVDPDGDGTFTQKTYYPQNVDILINGDPLGESLGDGDGPFEEVVDIKGELNEGTVNRIEATSDSIGNLQLFVEGDVYRQILGRG